MSSHLRQFNAIAHLVTLIAAFGLAPVSSAQGIADGEWRAYGHDVYGSRYSALSDINRDNVSRLTVAWTYHTGEPLATRDMKRSLEVTPLPAPAGSAANSRSRASIQ